MDYPILEFDPEEQAIIHPSLIYKPLPGMPDRVVFCFFQDVIGAVCGNGNSEPIYHIGSEIGRNPIYVIEHEGIQVAIVHAGVGASLSGTFLEETIALGGRKFIACGGAGVLDNTIAVGNVIVPETAIRDEGTSYHYLPPGREVAADEQAVTAIKDVLARHHIPYLIGKTWTTDAPYRETPQKVIRRREEGCLTVDMEAAAFFAIAQFRGVQFGQLLYGGDDVSGAEWDRRGWMHQKSTREKLFWLAVEAVSAL